MKRLLIPITAISFCVLEFTKPTAPGVCSPNHLPPEFGLCIRIKVTDPIVAFREWFGVFPAKAEV